MICKKFFYSQLAIPLFFLLSPIAIAESLTVIGFNVESGDADPNHISHQISEFQSVDIWGLSEVQNSVGANKFKIAAAEGERDEFKSILGISGEADRLQIIYNHSRLELVRQFELNEINIGGSVRAPLVAELRIRDTGQSFLLMVNHLYRGREDRRHQQAQMLNIWAQQQTLPVVAVGDYNFDWSVSDGDNDHDRGFDNMTLNNVFVWVRPNDLVKTHCSDFNSVLDFVFVSKGEQQRNGTSEIMFPESSYCPDNGQKSDHRPVKASFNIDLVDVTKRELVQGLERLQKELDSLKIMIANLPAH